jgi:hypothetical protein
MEAAGGIEPPYGALQGRKWDPQSCVAVQTSKSERVRVRTDSHPAEECRGMYAARADLSINRLSPLSDGHAQYESG